MTKAALLKDGGGVGGVKGVFIKSTCLPPPTRVQRSGGSLNWELGIISYAF